MQDWILLALAPVFLAFIAWEAWYWRHRRPVYSLVDTTSNIALALMHQVGDALAWAAVIGIYWWVYHYRLFDFPATVWSIAALFVAQDFFYYCFHRAHHRIRWMWTSHVTHHSSERLNLSTAFRQSLTYPLSGMWLGWLEKVFNTPSHHRVHHASNPRYIDRNYAGVLIIWDKLFGSFVEEDPGEPCRYGIVRPIRSHNPLVLTFHEWIAMFRDAARPQSPGSRLKQLFGPPERAHPRDTP